MTYIKPTVTIDLKEYNNLLKLKDSNSNPITPAEYGAIFTLLNNLAKNNYTDYKYKLDEFERRFAIKISFESNGGGEINITKNSK